MAIPSVICWFWNSISKYVFSFGFVCLPLSGLFFILHVIFNDEFLSRHAVASVLLSAVFFFTCCLLILSRICVLRRKSYAKNTAVEELWDTDLNFMNETDEVVCYRLRFRLKDLKYTFNSFLFKNPYEFSKFRPAYGMLLVTGLAFLVPFIAAISRLKEWNDQDDMYCVAITFAFPVGFLIGGFYVITNAGIYIASPEVDFYAPFDEYVQIPLKVFVGKAAAAFITAGKTHSVLVSFIIGLMTLSIISSNYIYHAADIENTLKSILPFVFPDARRFVNAFLITSCVACANFLVGLVLSSFVCAKESILGIMETNWRRNFVAIEFLLPNAEMENLQELKDALKNKRKQPLTKQEMDALNYIDFPIWRTKQPFRGRWIPAKIVPGDSSEGFQRPPGKGKQLKELAHEQQYRSAILVKTPEASDSVSSSSEEELVEKVRWESTALDFRRRRQSRLSSAIDDTPAAAAKSRHRRNEPESSSSRVLRPRKFS